MRSKLVIFLMLMFLVYLATADTAQPAKSSVDFEFKGYVQTQAPGAVREQDPPPTYEFILNGAGDATTYLYDSYYDYMPYSYNGFNVHKQPEISLPYGYSAGGFYISYHVSETTNTGTDRRAWNSYLNPDGTLLSSTATNQYSVIREGYTSSDIDPVTADPFFAWHSVVETDGSYDCSMTYDNFHLTGSTGYWKQPFILFDNPEVAEPYTGHLDEYIWPVIMIGDSPLEGHRRIHGYANGYTTNSAGHYMYNSVYGYADFNADSLLYESNLSWTYKTFPFMDEQHYNDLERVNKDMIVRGNLVAFFGDYGDTLFCHLSEDYGETFTLHTQEWNYPVENPIGTNGEYYWYDDDTVTPSVMTMVPSSDGSHYNGVLTKDDSRIVWMTGININSLENISQDLYMAAFFYPKVFWFDLNTHTFDFYCMDLQGVDPADDQPCIPWDLDEDGEVDEYYDDGGVYVPLSMSSYFFGTDQGYQDSFFHESAFHMAANGDYLVVIWQDCKKHRWA
ncbi:MAG: hypothetical protein JW784_06415, partial [Candidatus Cloacimonetes bacterium]|nr:hypothetical protein [Candidatus Cloacimonadota bacterium]